MVTQKYLQNLQTLQFLRHLLARRPLDPPSLHYCLGQIHKTRQFHLRRHLRMEFCNDSYRSKSMKKNHSTICARTASAECMARPFPLQNMHTLAIDILSPKYCSKPSGSTKNSASGTKKLCDLAI